MVFCYSTPSILIENETTVKYTHKTVESTQEQPRVFQSHMEPVAQLFFLPRVGRI